MLIFIFIHLNARRSGVPYFVTKIQLAQKIDSSTCLIFFSFTGCSRHFSGTVAPRVGSSRSQEGTREPEHRALVFPYAADEEEGPARRGRASPSTRIREFIASTARCTPDPIREPTRRRGTSPPG